MLAIYQLIATSHPPLKWTKRAGLDTEVFVFISGICRASVSIQKRQAAKVAFSIPTSVLWAGFQVLDSLKMARLYKVKVPLNHTIKMAIRVIRQA